MIFAYLTFLRVHSVYRNTEVFKSNVEEFVYSCRLSARIKLIYRFFCPNSITVIAPKPASDTLWRWHKNSYIHIHRNIQYGNEIFVQQKNKMQYKFPGLEHYKSRNNLLSTFTKEIPKIKSGAVAELFNSLNIPLSLRWVLVSNQAEFQTFCLFVKNIFAYVRYGLMHFKQNPLRNHCP